MARDFSKNTSNYLSLPSNTFSTLLNGLSAYSVHAIVNIDSTSTVSLDNRIISGLISDGSNGMTLSIDNTDGTRKLVCAGRSVAGETRESKTGTTDLALSTWYKLGGVFNIGGDTITPYVNGVAEGGGAVTFDNATYTSGAAPSTGDAIGGFDSNPTGTDVQFDGRICEVAIWNYDIGSTVFSQLASGYAASFFTKGLIFYMSFKVGANANPEVDSVGGKIGTIVGSLPTSTHPDFMRYPGKILINKLRPRIFAPGLAR